MFAGCMGCDEEYSVALEMQDLENFYFATAKGREAFGKKHFRIWMVDEKGRTVCD